MTEPNRRNQQEAARLILEQMPLEELIEGIEKVRNDLVTGYIIVLPKIAGQFLPAFLNEIIIRLSMKKVETNEKD